jgi:hypothetical protein
MAVFTCSQCGHSQPVDDRYIGKTAACPKCKTQAVVIQEQESSPVFVPEQEPSKRVIGATAGHLGIRCESWMDSERHINKASSLQVEWWVIIDNTLPIKFSEPCGLLVHNRANDYPLDLAYKAQTIVGCSVEPVSAFEVRYMTFNTWGDHVSTLAASEVMDLGVGERLKLSHVWNLYSDNEAEEFCVSLGFVSRVRLASGAVRNADLAFVLREAQRIAEKVTETDLEAKSPRRTG